MSDRGERMEPPVAPPLGAQPSVAAGRLAGAGGMDPLGRTVLEQQVSGLVQVIELDKPEMATGLYSAGLFAEGIRLGTAKFEVIH